MKNRLLKKLAEEYVVHFDHPEVKGDVPGAMNDHRDLLEDDQDCIETKIDVRDSSNTGDCKCKECQEIKTNFASNRLCKLVAKA